MLRVMVGRVRARAWAELTYKVPLPVGDVAADVASLLVVELQVDLGRETQRYTSARNMVRVKEAHRMN